MRQRILEIALWAGALAALVLAVSEARRRMGGESAPAPIVWPAPPPNATPSADSFTVLTARIVDADVFRIDRKPTTVPYRVSGDSSPSPPPPPAVPKPVLTLVGIVGGPPWAALIDGVPGHDGTLLVHARDTVGGLRVRGVSASDVTLSGLDTTWHLTTKHESP